MQRGSSFKRGSIFAIRRAGYLRHSWESRPRYVWRTVRRICGFAWRRYVYPRDDGSFADARLKD